MTREPKQLQIPSMQSAAPHRDYKPFTPGPNPELPEFIQQHSTPYDPTTDQYDVPAFSRDIVVDKAYPPKAIYDMHTYWSKKHWAAIREYIQHYLPDELFARGTGLILDCFSGSGMTGVAAMMENRPCVLIDASPVAAFISHCYTHPVEPEELQTTYDLMMATVYPSDLQKKLKRITGEEIRNLQQELDWLYATRCDRCGGPATTEYVVYSERFKCPFCTEIVALSECPEIKEPKKARYCPHCLAKNDGSPNKKFAISTRKQRYGAVPVKVVYRCYGKCKPKRGERTSRDEKRTRKGRYFLEHDLVKIQQIDSIDTPHWIPDRRMMDIESDSEPWGLEWRPGRDFRRVSDLYAPRNLWALAAWREARRSVASGDEWLDISLSVSSLTCSRMLTEQKRAITKGTYYLPQISRCIKPVNAFEYSLRTVKSVQSGLLANVSGSSSALVSNGSAVRETIPGNVLDYCFIDPPYMGKVQYGELNFVWETWLGFTGEWLKDEVVVNSFREKSVEDWDHDMRIVLGKCFSALKPGRWLSLCYHDTEPGTWSRLQDILLDVGFQIHTVTVLDPKQKSSNQITGDKVVKSDLVLNCKKPRTTERREQQDASESELVSTRVRDILIETLSKMGGQTRDKLWDTILKRLLTRGRMAEHRLDDILNEVAFRSESGHWFLREEFEHLSQSDIRNEEDAGAALERFTRLRAGGVPAQFAAHIALHAPNLGAANMDEQEIERYVRTKLNDETVAAKRFKLSGRMKGIEFYDCLYFYLTRYLKGRSDGKTHRRNVAEFMEEYLVRFKDGDKWLYRPPDRAESESLKKSRQTGLGRRIRQYCAFLHGEGDLPKEKLPDAKTLIAWLKHCAAFGLADEGVILFEKGGLAGQIQQLGEDDRYDAEDYYSQCKRKASKPTAEDEEPDPEEGGAEEDEE
jgi:16S rRNA G966 N2-methylase RsmD